MKKLSDEEYATLEKRVKDGKAFLAGKWASKDPQIREWITLWMNLGEQLFDEQCRRGVFVQIPNAEEMKKIQEATLERVRKQMEDAGLIRKKKGGRKKNDKPGSQSNSLFATSETT